MSLGFYVLINIYMLRVVLNKINNFKNINQCLNVCVCMSYKINFNYNSLFCRIFFSPFGSTQKQLHSQSASVSVSVSTSEFQVCVCVCVCVLCWSLLNGQSCKRLHKMSPTDAKSTILLRFSAHIYLKDIFNKYNI